MYSNNIVNFQVSTTILNACTKKKGWKLIEFTKYLTLIILFNITHSLAHIKLFQVLIYIGNNSIEQSFVYA